MNRPYATYRTVTFGPMDPPEAPKPLGLVLTAAPADTETLDTNRLLRDAMELCRRLNIEAVKVRVGKITYYAHKDHVVRKVRSNSWDVLKEPYVD